MTSYNQSHKRDLTVLAFAMVYITVGILLIYYNFTGVISSTIFAISIFLLIAASLLFKFATDFLRKKRLRNL